MPKDWQIVWDGDDVARLKISDTDPPIDSPIAAYKITILLDNGLKCVLSTDITIAEAKKAILQRIKADKKVKPPVEVGE